MRTPPTGSLLLLLFLPVLAHLIPSCETSATAGSAECSVNDDCLPIVNGSRCIDGNCTCPDSDQVLVRLTGRNSSYCLTGHNETGANCTFDQQCTYENSICLEEGTCGCDQPKFTEDGSGGCAPYAKSAIVPIAVGIAIGVSVFATLLLYLWLSSRNKV